MGHGRWRWAALVVAAVAGVLVGRVLFDERPTGDVTAAPAAVAVTAPEAESSVPEVRVARATVPASAVMPEPPAPTSNVIAATFHPRPEGEWQGMKVNLSLRATCEHSEGCGLAMACREDGLCGPCEADAHCAAGEVCVLDHCVRRELAACRTRADCGAAGTAADGEAALCVLSGYTPGDGRNNRDLRATCLVPTGGEREG